MKTRNLLIAGLVTFSAVIPATSLAAKPENDKASGFLNGKPFATLSAEVAANTQMLGNLSLDLQRLSSELAGIRTDVEMMQYQVGENTTNIAALLSDMADLQSASAATRAEIADLKAAYEADIETVKELISTLEDQVAASASQAIVLSELLQTAIADLNAQTEISNSTLLEVLSLNATVTSITASIAAVDATISDLESRLAEQELALMNLELNLNAGSAAAMGNFTAVTFETLNTDCSTAFKREFTWSINGSVIATSAGDTNKTCTCNGVVTRTVAGGASLAGVSRKGDGTDTIALSSPGSSGHYVSWSRATLVDAEGNSESVCLFDHAGGDCSVAKACDAGHTTAGIDVSISF